jgi:hypothetical protein
MPAKPRQHDTSSQASCPTKSLPTEQPPVANVAIQGTKGGWGHALDGCAARVSHHRSYSARSIYQRSSIFVSIRATPSTPQYFRKNWQNPNEATVPIQKPFQRFAIAIFRIPHTAFLTKRSHRSASSVLSTRYSVLPTRISRNTSTPSPILRYFLASPFPSEAINHEI